MLWCGCGVCVKCEVWEGYAGCGESVVSAVCVGCTACELRVAVGEQRTTRATETDNERNGQTKRKQRQPNSKRQQTRK